MADKREMGSFKPSILKDRFPLPHPRTQLHTPLKGNPECLSLPGGLGTPGPSGLGHISFLSCHQKLSDSQTPLSSSTVYRWLPQSDGSGSPVPLTEQHVNFEELPHSLPTVALIFQLPMPSLMIGMAP